MAAPADLLLEILRPERLTAVVDVGANPIDGDPPYKQLLVKRLCNVVGFEPQPEALASLNARKSDLERYFPYALGDGGKASLRICQSAGMTSLLRPNQRVLKHFKGFTEWAAVLEEVSVQTIRLDDVTEIDVLDFLKIDIQGSELAVFQGGHRLLAKALAIQTEVSFLPLYEGQPVLGNVDLELREIGFVPHSFAAINKRMILPTFDQKNPYAAMNQLLWADIVYVRDFTQPELMDSEQLKHLAIVAHHCYRSYDLAVNCIFHLAQRGEVPKGSLERYIAGAKVSG
jgi:FkbM family methyltransferase